MRKQYTHRPTALRFRRWSRRAYAAFVSVQHTVTIGRLSANVANRFQTKNRSLHSSASLKEYPEGGTAPTADLLPDGTGQPGLTATATLQRLETVAAPSLQTAEAAAHSFLLKNNTIPTGKAENLLPTKGAFRLAASLHYIYDLH